MKKFLALVLVLAVVLGTAPFALAATENGLDDLPAGTYTYVGEVPTAEVGSGVGQVQFVWAESKLVWAYGGEKVQSGSVILDGDELEFFQGLYLSDRPVYDWLVSAPRDTTGIAGNVSGNLEITLTEDGKISELYLATRTVQILAVLTKEITAPTLTIEGNTGGSPNLTHSCITVIGSTNCLYLTGRGNVVLDNTTIGHNEDGVGLIADKTGADTFIAGTVVVDGIVKWNNRYANLQPVTADAEATLMTTGKDIIMGGMNIGRVGRNLNISTGEDLGGDIIIGEVVSVDYGRGGLLADPSKGTLILSTSGDIIAGKGDVIIGTNTERIVKIDMIGDIQGANVTIKPTDNGKVAAIGTSIGNITATESVQIEVAEINSANDAAAVLGNITSGNGDVTIVTGSVNGTIGNISAANGTAKVTIASVDEVGEVTGAKITKDIGLASEAEQIIAAPTNANILVNGAAVDFDAYIIDGSNYFKLRDIAYVFDETEKEFELNWYGTVDAIITMWSGREYEPDGNEMVGISEEEKPAIPVEIVAYLDSNMVSIDTYKIGDDFFFKLRDIAEVMDFAIVWDGVNKTITVNTAEGYTQG